jgi:hypothetical protein
MYCTLISIAPKYSLATYFDSGSAEKKNYAEIRGVLDDSLEGYFKKGGAFKDKGECFRDDGKHKLVQARVRVPLCQAAGWQHSGGLLCHASPKRVYPG